MDANTFFKNMKHAEIECPVCEKLKKDCKKVYYDEWHDEYVCKKCGLVIKNKLSRVFINSGSYFNIYSPLNY
nr:hypothetical protein [Methanobrevibacter smithii]